MPVTVAGLQKWRSRSAAELAAALDAGQVTWGLDEDGRDPLASLASSLLEREPHPRLAALVRKRALDESVPLKPSFRLFLLGGGRDRVVNAEKLRASGGDTHALPEFRNAEVSELEVDGRELRVFRTPGDLAAMVGGFPEGVRLGAGDGAAGAVRRVAGLEKQPFLRFAGRRQWFGETSRLLAIVGGASGLLLAGLLAAGVVFGLREAKLARSRMDLAATVAHELRTPLAGQKLVLEALAADAGESDRQRDYVTMALRENSRLCHLAEEFLTFSRLERGSARQRDGTLVVRDILQHAVELMAGRLDEGDFAIEAEDDLTITGDPGELATVVRNLVENALNYSDGMPWVRLRARRGPEGVLIEVEDHGRGIGRRDRKRIFRQFHRGDRTLARRSEGIGLGLAIVRRIVSAHHGRIELLSEPGRGSIFRLHFPTLP